MRNPRETPGVRGRTCNASCRSHNNVRIGRMPILRVTAILCTEPLRSGSIEGETMLKSSGFLPIATALVGLGIFALGTQVRAGGDKGVFPDGFEKGVLFTTVDRAYNKQFREFYTSHAALDAAKK